MTINFGNVGDIVPAVSIALTYMRSILLFGVPLTAWLTLSILIPMGVNYIKRVFSMWGAFRFGANDVAGNMGFLSQDERFDFSNVNSDMDLVLDYRNDEV